MGDVKHPGRTQAQRRVLDTIGCGDHSPMMAKSTRDALLAAGLIVRLPDRIIGGGWLAVHVEQFEMPIPVHMQWCSAVAEEFPDAD